MLLIKLVDKMNKHLDGIKQEQQEINKSEQDSKQKEFDKERELTKRRRMTIITSTVLTILIGIFLLIFEYKIFN